MVPVALTNYEAEYLPSHKVNEARMMSMKAGITAFQEEAVDARIGRFN
jgi:hypothetical protein